MSLDLYNIELRLDFVSDESGGHRCNLGWLITGDLRMDLTIIIVNWNSAQMLENCLRSIQQWITGISYEAIVVDNGSAEEDRRLLREKVQNEFLWAKFIFSDENLGFARANNLALKSAAGDYILLLNPDTCFINAGFERLLGVFALGDVGIVHCKLLNEDKTTQPSLYHFPRLTNILVTSLLLHKILPKNISRRFQFSIEDHQLPQTPDWVMGAFMLLPKEVMLKVGGFDEQIFMYGEDLDLCFRIEQLGLKIFYVPNFAIVHYGGESGKQVWSDAEREGLVYKAIIYFYRKHFGNGQLVMARVIFAAGAILRLLVSGFGSILRGEFQRGLYTIKTQWVVLLAQLNFK